jgi:AraC-like DNA-binding protein
MNEIFNDIRNLYDFRKPIAPLAEYVEFYSETSLSSVEKHIQTEHYSIKLYPSYTPTIWINLGKPYILEGDNLQQKIAQQNDIIVLRHQTLDRQVHHQDRIFTVKFLPLGFESIFGYSQSKLSDFNTNAADLLGYDFILRLKKLETLDDKVVSIESYLLGKVFNNAKPIFNGLSKAIRCYENSNFSLKITEIAAEVFLTEKTFNRHFHQTIGTNPRRYFGSHEIFGE